MDALVIAPHSYTVFFEYCELALDGLQITIDITGITILRDQFERYFLAASPNQDRDMWFLHAFRLVDSTPHLIILTLEMSLLLCPHRQNDLECLAQEAQACRCIRVIVAITAILMFVPTSTNTEVESSVREDIDSTRHLCQQRGITIAIAGNCLTNADTFCVTCHSSGGGPALERHFLRWSRNSMKVIAQPERRITFLIGDSGNAGHRLISFNRIFNTRQF